MKLIDLASTPGCLRRSLSGALSFALGLSLSAEASTSGIVGFYNLPLPAGNSAWVCGLVTTDSYQGAAASVTADTDGLALVQFSSPGWTVNEFNLHYAEPQSGAAAGLAIDILSNTSDTLKLNSTPAAAGLSSGMVFIVRKHATLAGLLPDGAGLVPLADSVSIFSAAGVQSTYTWNNFSSRWINGFGQNANNTVIRPGQGMGFQVSSAITITLGKGEVCHVKTTATKVKVNGNSVNLVGPLNPLGGTTTLSGLGMTSSMGTFSDSIVTLAQGTLNPSGTYLSNGSNLINGFGQNANNTSLPAGASVVVNVGSTKNISLAPVTPSP